MNVFMPTTLTDACNMLVDAGTHGRIIAGGTDLLVHWPQQLSDVHANTTWIDLSGIDSLKQVTWKDETVTLGALVTYWDVIQNKQIASEFPLLLQAARVVGSIQIQTRGTWAGNIMNGSPAADGVLALMAYDTSIVLTSTSGRRTVPLDVFYTAYRTTVAAPGEVIEAIVIRRGEHDFQHFEKVGTRQAQAVSKVGLALTHSEAASRWRVVMNSMAPTVRRCPTIEKVLHDRQAMSEPDDWLSAIDADVSPIDDLRSTARYRRMVAARMLQSALAGYCNGIAS